jgi:hypothetical protein
MPYYEFQLQVDAVKHVPVSSGTSYQVRWFLNDDVKGHTDVCPRVGDEVTFQYATKFGIETRGVIGQLLQLSLVDLGQREGSPHSTVSAAASTQATLAGVLMIDLNAHVPKPPKQSSRQRATLGMSRCQHDPAILIRLGLECAPADAPPQPLAGLNSTQRPTREESVPGISPLPRAPSSATLHRAGSLRAASERGGDAHAAVTEAATASDQQQKALISALSSANDQLRDEVVVLRRALERARADGEYTYSSRQLHAIAEGQQGNTNTTASELAGLSTRAERLKTELDAAKEENETLKKGLNTAKESMRQLMETDRDLRKQNSTLSRAKAFLEGELDRLQKELDTERQHGRGSSRTSEGELTTTREMLASSQQMGRDLRAMLHSAETLAESLKRELTTARREAAESSSRAVEAVRFAEARATDAEATAGKARDALLMGQQELAKMHQYCVDIAGRLKATVEALNKEKSASRQYLRQLEDLRAVNAAQTKFTAAMGRSGTNGSFSGVNASGTGYAASHHHGSVHRATTGGPLYNPYLHDGPDGPVAAPRATSASRSTGIAAPFYGGVAQIRDQMPPPVPPQARGRSGSRSRPAADSALNASL